MTAVTPEPILKVAMGFMAAKHLFVASEVGLFEALAAGPATIEELASQTGVPSRTIAIATAAMVSLGFIEQHGHHYQNGEQVAAFLAGKPGPDLRPMLRFFDQISYPAWQKLADAVRTGNGQAQFGKFDKRQQKIFSAGVESFSGPGAAALAAPRQIEGNAVRIAGSLCRRAAEARELARGFEDRHCRGRCFQGRAACRPAMMR